MTKYRSYSFANKGNELEQVILVIHNKTGVYIDDVSDYIEDQKDFEVMTRRGARYKVLRKPEKIRMRWYIELEEI